MNYQEFLNQVKEEFSSRLPEGASVNLQQVVKNNGVIYDALVTFHPDINMSPTVYLNPYYMKFMNTSMSFEEICNCIWKVFEENMPTEDFDITNFLDFEKARDHIIPRVVNKERNQNLLSDIPHREFLGDLAIVYYCLLESDETGQGSIMVRNNHMEAWHTTEENLYALAIKNGPLLLPVKFSNMYDALSHMLPEDINMEDLEILPMHVLTNRYRTNGASVMAYHDVMEMVCEQLNSDLIILPSSVHELIILTADEEYSYDYYCSLIDEVNTSQLHEDEVLSDHPYYYKRGEGFIL